MESGHPICFFHEVPQNEQSILLPNPWRVALAIFAAAMVPAVLFGPHGFEVGEVATLAGFGVLSVVTTYLPLLSWLLPKTRHRLLPCVLLGEIAAPGPLGYGIALVGWLLLDGAVAIAVYIFLLTAPLGLFGGLVFWLCAIWRIEEVQSATP